LCEQTHNIKEIDLANDKSNFDSLNNQHQSKIYVAVSTMISPIETFNLYKDLIDYISSKLGVPIEFKQRKPMAK